MTGRAELSAQLWEVAKEHIVGEMICCEPLDPEHTLCARGYDILEMVEWLLVGADPKEAWNPQPVLLDAVVRAVDDRLRVEAQKLRARAAEFPKTRTGRLLKAGMLKAADQIDVP